MHRRPLLLLTLLAAAGPLAALGPLAPGDGADGAPETATLTRALERAIESAADRPQLRLLVECREDAGAGTLEVHGNGVGIWSGRRQFRLAPTEVADLLRILRDAGFAEMKDRYGGKGISDPGVPEGGGLHDPASATVMVCSIDLELGELVKRVVQLAPGPRSPEVMGLAAELLDAVRERGEAGVAAQDLEDGLAKLAAGELAPEALRLTLTRRPDAATGAEGFLLRLGGREATTRVFSHGEGYGPEIVAALDAEELAAVAGRVARARPSEMPANLWAESYTDLALDLLGQRKVIQARRFAGLDRGTHGAVQERFDRLIDVLEELETQIRINGVARDGG